MRLSTLLALIITVLLTVVIMQNTDEVKFTLLFTEVYIPKLVMMTASSVTGFILGILLMRPRKVKHPQDYFDHDDEDHRASGNGSTLSDEDRDYIS